MCDKISQLLLLPMKMDIHHSIRCGTDECVPLSYPRANLVDIQITTSKRLHLFSAVATPLRYATKILQSLSKGKKIPSHRSKITIVYQLSRRGLLQGFSCVINKLSVADFGNRSMRSQLQVKRITKMVKRFRIWTEDSFQEYIANSAICNKIEGKLKVLRSLERNLVFAWLFAGAWLDWERFANLVENQQALLIVEFGLADCCRTHLDNGTKLDNIKNAYRRRKSG